MRKNQKGFGVVEIFLIVVTAGLIGFVGWYLYKAHINKTKPVVATQSRWLTYKSTAGPSAFSYPPSWHLRKLSLSDRSSNALEDVGLDGPNHFSMNYYVGTRPTGPNIASCIAFPPPTKVSINSQYLMILVMATNSTASISMQSTSDLFEHNCQTFNGIATTGLVFTFDGQYQYGSRHGTTSNSAYLRLPEVKTAKAIFASFNTGVTTNSATSAPSQCGCREFGTCADISACEGSSAPAKP